MESSQKGTKAILPKAVIHIDTIEPFGDIPFEELVAKLFNREWKTMCGFYFTPNGLGLAQVLVYEELPND